MTATGRTSSFLMFGSFGTGQVRPLRLMNVRRQNGSDNLLVQYHGSSDGEVRSWL
jgi:hypothetical protein